MSLSQLTIIQANKLYADVVKDKDAKTMRRLCVEDLFFLLVFACRRKDMNREWIYDRVREVEANPDDCLDLWAREHYKSSIITFGLTVQDVLKDPEMTCGIFSHTRPIAKSFLAQIKREFETNQFLKDLFPDVLYQNPHKESPKWSLDDGIIVKRKANPKESTIEAWGLVDGQPTSKHYRRLIYDDVVTKDSVSTPEMIAKTTEAFSLSLNLAGQDCRRRFIGTRYHANDTYKTILDRGTATPRIYPGTKDGTVHGDPVLLTRQQLDEKLRDMGSYVFSSQILQNPVADKAMGFKSDWLMFYNMLNDDSHWNFYIIVDSASAKKIKNTGSDYTAMKVVGLAPDKNYYLVDGLRDRLNLTERTKALFNFVRKWNPKNVGYEKYGKDSDIEHIQYVQEQENFRFNIQELGGSLSKDDRIRRLVPDFENHRFYFPRRLLFISAEGKVIDLIKVIIDEEYTTFPVCSHDDSMDCLSRIKDPDLMAVFPKIESKFPSALPQAQDKYDPFKVNGVNTQEVYNPFAMK